MWWIFFNIFRPRSAIFLEVRFNLLFINVNNSKEYNLQTTLKNPNNTRLTLSSDVNINQL